MSPISFNLEVTVHDRFYDGTQNPERLYSRLADWCDFLVKAATSDSKQVILHEEDICRLRRVILRGRFQYKDPRKITIWIPEKDTREEFKRLSEGVCEITEG